MRSADLPDGKSAAGPRLGFAQMAGIAAALAVLVPFFFAALIARNHGAVIRETSDVERRQRGLALANELGWLVIEMETAVRGFRNTGKEEFLEPYREATARYRSILAELDRTLLPGKERALLSRIRGSIERWRSRFGDPRIAYLRLHPPRSAGGEVILSDLPAALEPEVGRRAMDSIRRQFDELKSLQHAAASRNLAEMRNEQAGLSRLLWTSALAFSVALFLGAAWLGARYRRRMGILFSGIAEAERGGYAPVPLLGADEPARIAAAFNRVVREVERRDEQLHRSIDLQRRLTEERTRAFDTLAVAHKELEAFSYSVSHDLRAPLRHITGFAELLGRHADGALDERARGLLAKISASARQMGRLVDDLLVFSRMRLSGMAAAAVPLSAVVEDIRSELESLGQAKGVSWAFDRLPVVRGDAPMLRMALANLISNAVKYSGGRSDPRVEIGSFTEGSETVVFVRDNGVGFDPRYSHKLFGVFQRLHADDEFEGTGIGLANVRRIIQRHGGRTWAEGEVGAGATFFFSLPHSEERHP